MTRYIVRRLLSLPLLLLGIVSLAFLISHFTQGDPLASIVSERQMDNPEVIAAAKARWGLDKSLPEQYLIYVGNLLTGDLGTSFRTKQPVSQDLLERLPATLELVIAAMIFGSVSGIVLGVLAARFRDRGSITAPGCWRCSARRFRSSGPASSCSTSFPSCSAGCPGRDGSMQIGGARWHDRLSHPRCADRRATCDLFWDALHHLLLPAFVLGWTVTGIVSRLVRASMLDVLNQDYILAARAKGAGELRVLLHHALRNALIPTLTIIGYSFAYLITGAVLTETIFAWPGMGSYAVDSARTLDYPAIIGVTLIGGAAFLLTNLVTDIAYAFANPRIRLS